jgi:hypothetical protein
MKWHTLARTLARLVLGTCALCLIFSFRSARNPDGVSAAGGIPEGRQDSAASSSPASTPARAPRIPVLVELFTSEDCAGCPSVDSMLHQLEHEQPVLNTRIIVLREHVDSSEMDAPTESALLSDPNRRLKEYQKFFHLDDASLPKIVLNGMKQFDRSNLAEIKKAIGQAANAEPIPLQIRAVQDTSHVNSFTLQPGMPATPDYVNVYAALVDSGDTNSAPAGAEEGQSPTYSQAVKNLAIIGSSWRTDALGKSPFFLPSNLSAPPVSWRRMRLIVFVQTNQIGRIQGVAFYDFIPVKPDTDG